MGRTLCTRNYDHDTPKLKLEAPILIAFLASRLETTLTRPPRLLATLFFRKIIK